MEKLKLVGKLEDHTFKKEEAELKYLFVCLFDDENIVASGNHAIGFLENPPVTQRVRLARFKEVALIDPDFIAFAAIGSVLVFDDMEMIIVDNIKTELCDECIEEEGF